MTLPVPVPPPPTSASQEARLSVRVGGAMLQAEVRVSPAGLLAIGGMVGMILLGSAAIVWTARRPAW